MLLRRDGDGVLAIGQQAHAWVSGQLARAWGDARVGEIEPREEVCLAAEQHDIEMSAWDLAPTRNAATGLPHDFTEMPIETHLRLWSAGPSLLLSQCRYASLLASMHGFRLYEHRDLTTVSTADAAAASAFLAEQRVWQERLIATLRADPLTAAGATPELITRNSDLLRIWDFLSLAICLDWAPCVADDVPAAEGTIDVNLEVAPGAIGTLTVDPWPFTHPDEITVRCEGRRLHGPYNTDAALQAALDAAPWETLEFRLLRRRS
jgi:hypothetical protein